MGCTENGLWVIDLGYTDCGLFSLWVVFLEAKFFSKIQMMKYVFKKPRNKSIFNSDSMKVKFSILIFSKIEN